jgi:glycosyltransferase involved in cell wall biosynthesis
MTGVSVVVPTKDRLRYLQRAIPMFLGHDEVKEVIVVIDGCQDGSLEYIRAASAKDERIRYVDNVQNRGLPYSRNRGIDIAKFEYVFTGEDDLELTEDFFKTLFSHMREAAADIISGRNIFRLETETAAEAIRRADSDKGEPVDRRLIAVNTGMAVTEDREQPLLPAPMLGSADVFREIRFDESYEVNFWREESDFQLSAQERGYRLVFCPHAISFNFMIENDRGGSHSAIGLKRVRWIVKNNWRFVKKHRRYISKEFAIGNLYIYITRFTLKRVFMEVIGPLFVGAKRKMLAILRIA